MVVSSSVEQGDAAPFWVKGVLPALALAATAGLFLLQSRLPGPLPTALMLLAIAVPLGAFGTYLSTLARIRAFSALSDESLIRRYLPGTWIRLVVGWLAGLVGAALVAVQLLTFGPVHWSLLAAAVPVFLVTWRLIGERLRREVRPCYRVGWPLRAATVPASLVLVLFETTATVLGGGVPQYPNLASAIDAGRVGAPMFGDSAIAAVLVNAAGILNGLQAYALGLLSGSGGLRAAAAVLALALLAWPFHWVVCCYVASFLVPRREYARVLAPLVDAPVPPPVPAFRIFGAASLGALVLLVIYPSLVAMTDQWLRSRTWVSEQLDRIEVTVERVDDILVREGTLAEIARKGEEIAARRVEQRATLEAELNAGFDRMEGNVDAYLDWYYSLPAEYARTASMLVGGLEGYMAARLTDLLGTGDPFAAVEAELGRALKEDAVALEEYRTAVAEILQRNRVETGTDPSNVTVVAEARSDHLMLVPEDGLVPLKARLGVGAAGGVAGALSAAIAAKVVAKMMAKGVLKAGAKTLLKVGGGKFAGSAGGAAAGAAAGAAVGSIVPGIGTAIGAVVGGVVAGLAVGGGAEYLMLKLEEAYSRDDHRADLVAELRRMRAEAIYLLTSTSQPVRP